MSASSQPASAAAEPAAVMAWFEHTYRTRGLRYLRPIAAYPIYLQLLNARAGEALLDVGCGPGLLLATATARGLAAHGIDVAHTALTMARSSVAGAELVRGSALELPFADQTFDLLTCLGVIERLRDRAKVLREMHRVVKPGGRLCFLVRNAQSMSWRVRCALGRQDRASHQDAATLEQWGELFETAGFAIDAVHIDQWWRQRLRRWYRGRPDFTRAEPIARPVLPLRLALEFIFLLRKPLPSQAV